MSLFFNFGETVKEYDFKVINEREARASAGIMFLFGIVSFLVHFQFHSMFWPELFAITFIVEFFIRTVINPKYAPYMLLASIIVSNQKPDWVEAKPKQFAWILGAVLGLIMVVFIVGEIKSPIRLATCLICLILLFTESAFGICLGCIIYKKFNISLQQCPGGVCETALTKTDSRWKLFVLFIFLALFSFTYSLLKTYKYQEIVSRESPKSIYVKM